MYYTTSECCPECGSDDIMVIDREFDHDEQKRKQRVVCDECGHDYWEDVEE